MLPRCLAVHLLRPKHCACSSAFKSVISSAVEQNGRPGFFPRRSSSIAPSGRSLCCRRPIEKESSALLATDAEISSKHGQASAKGQKRALRHHYSCLSKRMVPTVVPATLPLPCLCRPSAACTVIFIFHQRTSHRPMHESKYFCESTQAIL